MTIKEKFRVAPISYDECCQWILNKHYAKRMPSISYSFGLFDGSMLIGVLTIGKPASNSLCEGICGKENSAYVYELNRLCVVEGLPKNALSFFVSQCFKKLPPMILVSYADTSMNHVGYIYQATNWLYIGLSAKRIDYALDEDAHTRHAYVGKDTDGAKRIERPRKHRYLYLIGNRSIKKSWISTLNYDIKPYPKGESQRYDASYKPTVQLKLFI